MNARRLPLILLALGALLVSTPAAANHLDPIEVTVLIGVDSYNLYDLPTVYAHSTYGGTYTLDADENLLNGIQPLATSDYSILWESSYDVDPLVTNSLTITNTTAGSLTVDVTVTSPVVPQTPGTIMGGSVGLTLTNTGGVATAATSSGIGIYTALIDGVAVQTLLPDAYTLMEAVFLDTETDSASFGLPFPGSAVPGPAANTDIGIRIRFVLSPGDSLGVTSVFNVEAAPEPGLLGLVGLALGAAFARRRG